MSERFPITLALHLLLNAPEPSLDAIYHEVARITGDVRAPTTPIEADLTNPHHPVAGNLNVHGVRYFTGRSANFVMESEDLREDERGVLHGGAQYGWEVRSGHWHADGTTYNGSPGYIEWHRLD